MKIVFSGGGTLGPVTPLIAVIKALRTKRAEAVAEWIGTKDGPEARVVRGAGVPYHAISAGKLRRYFSRRNLVDPFLVLAGLWQAWRLLGRLRPAAVVSAGGFVAVPVVWAAWLRRIPVHVHQQDLRPGLANKLSAPFASSVSVALEKSLADFAGKRPEWTGNPVRPELFSGSRGDAARLFGLEENVPVVLVLGGGTGAAGLNALVRGALPRLTERAFVIHSAGPGKTDPGFDGRPRYRQYALLTSELPQAFAAADLVITRAGMGVLTELAALGLPAIIVPMPGSHQEENAGHFAGRGAGLVLDERAATPDDLARAALALLGDVARLQAMREAMRAMTKGDAAGAVADLILKAARRTDD